MTRTQAFSDSPKTKSFVHVKNNDQSCGRHPARYKFLLMRIFDIGANLVDEMFKGIYRSKHIHPPDLSSVLRRARQQNVTDIILTASHLRDTLDALEIIQQHSNTSDKENGVRLSTTVGVHPCTALEFENNTNYLDALKQQLTNPHVIAVGECGLDYDRLEYCPASKQLEHFELQFELTEQSNLPIFLHMRAAANDFIDVIRRNRRKFNQGVVHSFTDSWETAQKLLGLGLFIGINGCSLKTEMGVEVVRKLPVDRLMVESDAPWCEMRASHAGTAFTGGYKLGGSVDKSKHDMELMVKGRNEPCATRLVLEAIAGIKGIPIDELAEQVYANTTSVFQYRMD